MCKQRKILSYCLFQTNKNNPRKWDKYQNIPDRYFVNLPFLFITKAVLFPQYKMKFHIDTAIRNNPLFDFIEIASSLDDSIDFEILNNKNVNSFAPGSWRMKPFFSEETDVLYCRDIDSLTTSREFKTMMFFENSQYKVYTNRSNVPGHKSDRIKILAGLCGFKPKEIELNITFEEFINEEYHLWTQDQFILEKHFCKLSKDKFLDVPTREESAIGRNEDKTSIWYENLSINISDYVDSRGEKYLTFLDSLTTWEGEPLDVRKYIDTFLSFDEKTTKMIQTIFDGNAQIRRFYGK